MAVYELRGIDDTLRDILNTLKSGIATASTGPSSVTIIGDYVGLARDSTLQSILNQLRSPLSVTGSVAILRQPISVSPSGIFPVSGTVGIVADYVGLARDSSLQSILSQLRSILYVTGSVGIVNQPVSVSPSTTFPISGTVGITADYVGLARDSSLQSILNQLRSYVVVTGTVNIGSSSIMVPVDIQGAAINVPINVVTDSVGLARDSSLQSILGQLRSTLSVTGTVGIIADYVGLARDSTLQSILSQLRSYVVVTGTVNIGSSSIMVPVDIQGAAINVPINIVTDSVGIARDSTAQSILSQLRSTLATTGTVGIIADYVGLARDSSLQSILNQLRTYVVVTGTVNIGSSSIMVPVDIQGAAINVPINVVTDSVGLARDSTLQSVLSQLRSTLAVTGSVGILGQPISVVPGTTFPVSGSVGIIADYVGLARDSSLQSILNQLRSVLYVTGSVGILGQPISVSPSGTFPVSGTIGIAADYVGLARDSSLQSILTQLKSYVVVTGSVGILGQPILVSPSSTFPVSGNIGIIADNVGLARDSTLQTILTRLQSILYVTGSVGIVNQPVSVSPSTTFPISGSIGIIADSVGLARDSSLQSILSQLRTSVVVTGAVGLLGQPLSVSPSTTFPVSGNVGIAVDFVGLARDSSLQSILSQLRSYVVVTGTVNIGSSSIMVPVDIQGAAINVPINIVTDSVGLARDSTLNNMRYRLYGVNPDATGSHDIDDSNTYTVTATSWTQVQCYTFYPRYMPVKSYAFYVIAGIQGYIDTSGQTLYVRIRDTRSGTTAQASTGSTSNAWMFPSMTVFAHLNEWFGICVDAYVTSGTGYITYVWLYIHPIDTAWALTSWNTGGYTAVPLTATANNNLKIAFAEDLIGVARDSTVASTKLRGGTLNVSSITMNPNTAYTLIGSNSNRISVAVLNSGAGTLYIGPSTTSLIWPVYPGQTIVLNYINALYGQTTDTGTVVIMELAY